MSERYARQEMIRGWDPSVIGSARVLVIGAGTTGNEVIKNLVLLGIGHITILDYDNVEEVNLSRSILFRDEDIGLPKAETAARRARDINRLIDIEGKTCDVIYEIGSQFYINFDCVILTVDNLEARMIVNRYCWQNNIPLINTGINGQRGDVFMSLPPHGGCIECSWQARDYQRLSEKYSCLKLGLVSEDQKIPMVITTAAVIGGIAVQECVHYLHARKGNKNLELPVMDNLAYHYMAEENQALLSYSKSPNPDCHGHTQFLPLANVLKRRIQLTDRVEEVISLLITELPADQIEIHDDKEIVYSAVCNHCGFEVSSNPIYLGKFKRALCPSCNAFGVMPKSSTAQLLPGYTFAQLNIPAMHRLKVLYLKDGEVQVCWVETE